MAGKDLIGSTLYGESMIVSGQPVRISGEIVRIQGYDYSSAVHRTIAVDKSGQILVNIEIADIVQARISGQLVISKISGQNVGMLGYDYPNGVYRRISVDSSGALDINVTIADIVQARISGQTVISKVSGQTIVAKISGQRVEAKVSGQAIKISGQTVLLAGTPAVGVSGATVIARVSGQTVISKISGAQIAVTGTVIISGTIISKISGQVVKMSGQTVYIAGTPAMGVSGATVIARISGQRVQTSVSGNLLVARTSGQTHISKISGQAVKISGQIVNIAGQTLIAKISGQRVETSISGNVLNISGQVTIGGDVLAKISGQLVVARVSGQTLRLTGTPAVGVSGQTVVAKISGQRVEAKVSGALVIAKISGQEVQIIPASNVRWQKINCTAASGGTAFASCQVRSAIFRALSGTVWIGGNQAGHYPYSGGGMPTDGGEGITLDVDNFNRIRGCAPVSGRPLAAIGIY